MIGIQPGYQPLKTSCQCAFLDPLTKHSPPCPKTDEKKHFKNVFLDRDSTWNAGFESKCTEGSFSGTFWDLISKVIF